MKKKNINANRLSSTTDDVVVDDVKNEAAFLFEIYLESHEQ